MVFDPFRALSPIRPQSASDLRQITPNDTKDLDVVTDALLLATSGDVRVITERGTTITLPALAAGYQHPYRVSRVMATGTTATGIIGVYMSASGADAAPGKVTGLTATAGYGQAVLAWNAVTASPSVTGYRIERRIGTGSWDVIVASHTGTSFTDTGLANGTVHSYRVSAANAIGTGPASVEATTTPTTFAALSGVLDAPNVVVLGASHVFQTYGDSTALGEGVAERFANIGFTGTLSSYAVGGDTISGAVTQYDTARQAPGILATEGSNLYILDIGGNNILYNLPYPNVAASVDSQLRALVTDITSRGDTVIVMPQTKRYPPWSNLTEGDDLDVAGMLPYNLNIYHPIVAEFTPDWVDASGVPYVNPYELADKWRDIVGSDGNHGYQRSLHEYHLNRMAARAKALKKSDSRSGSFVMYQFRHNPSGVSAHDYSASGGSNQMQTTQYVGVGNTFIGAARYGGGFDHFITVRTSAPRGIAIADTATVNSRIADTRFHGILNPDGIYFQDAEAGWVEIHELPPGAQVKISVVSSRAADTQNRTGIFTLTGGESVQIDARMAAATNFHAFDPITVPSDGMVRLDISVLTGVGFAYLTNLGIDFL